MRSSKLLEDSHGEGDRELGIACALPIESLDARMTLTPES